MVVPPSQPVLQKSQSFTKKDILLRLLDAKMLVDFLPTLAVLDIDKSQDIDEEESDLVSPLLERALRWRGLSDSSIHSTFTSQAIIQIYHLPIYLPSPIGVPSFKP